MFENEKDRSQRGRIFFGGNCLEIQRGQAISLFHVIFFLVTWAGADLGFSREGGGRIFKKKFENFLGGPN